MGSSGEGSVTDGVWEGSGITRLGTLAEGVKKGVLPAGVLMDEAATDRKLSLLRERFEDEGEAGTASGVDMFCASVWTPPLTLALRLKARSLCSLKRVDARI